MINLNRKYPQGPPSRMLSVVKDSASLIQAPINIPIGSVVLCMSKDVSGFEPTGEKKTPWIRCDGRSIARQQYPQLETVIEQNKLSIDPTDSARIIIPSINSDALIGISQNETGYNGEQNVSSIDVNYSTIFDFPQFIGELGTDFFFSYYDTAESKFLFPHAYYGNGLVKDFQYNVAPNISYNLGMKIRKNLVIPFFYAGLSKDDVAELEQTVTTTILSDQFIEKVGNFYIPEDHIAVLYRNSFSYRVPRGYRGLKKIAIYDKDYSHLENIPFDVSSSGEVSFHRSISIKGEKYVETYSYFTLPDFVLSLDWLLWNTKGDNPCLFGLVNDDDYCSLEQLGYSKRVIAQGLDVKKGQRVVIGLPTDYPIGLASFYRDGALDSLLATGELKVLDQPVKVGNTWYMIYTTEQAQTDFFQIYTAIFADKIR